MTTKLKGNGIAAISKRYPNFKRDLKHSKTKILDLALKEQYTRNPSSSSLTGVKEIAREYMQKNFSYSLSDGEQACLQDRVSDHFNNKYKRNLDVYNKWHKKLPNIFNFPAPKPKPKHFTQSQKEVKLPSLNTDSNLYSVHIVNSDGELIRALKMSPDDVIQKLL